MLESCMRPELVTEITLQPVRRHNVDAAIYFSDIVVPLKAIGVDLDIKPGVGPVVAKPIRTPRRPRAAARPDPRGRLVRHRGDRPAHRRARRHPAHRLRRRAVHPRELPRRGRPVAQPRAHQGADVRRPAAVGRPARPPRGDHLRLPQGPDRGRRLAPSSSSTPGSARSPRRTTAARCMPASAKVFEAVASYGVPRIHFGVGTGELLGLMGEAGADVVGVDWRVPLDEAARRVGPGKALQGNLDPAVLFAAPEAVEAKTRRGPRRGRRPGGPRLQPRPRRPADDRPGRADPPGGVRPHQDGPLIAVAGGGAPGNGRSPVRRPPSGPP